MSTLLSVTTETPKDKFQRKGNRHTINTANFLLSEPKENLLLSAIAAE
jgi:hypothetical protein